MGIVIQIYTKAMNKWQDRQAAATSDNQIQILLIKLKKYVSDSKLAGRDISEADFEAMVT